MPKFVTFMLLLPLALACHRGEQQSDCWNARRQARDALSQGKLTEASHLLEQARSTCGARASDDIRRIETVISDRLTAKRRLDSTKEEQKRLQESPKHRFIQWATARLPRQEFESSLTNVKCAEQDESSFGFCEAERQGEPNMTVRYWQRDHTAARYTLTTQLPLQCADLGEHRPLRKWSKNGQAHELCELLERTARGLSALLIRESGTSRMHIFSFEYLKRDSAFERELRPQR